MKSKLLLFVLVILTSLAMAQVNQKPPVLTNTTTQTGNIPVIQPGQVPPTGQTPPPPPGQTPPPPPGQNPPPPPPGQTPPSPPGQTSFRPDIGTSTQAIQTAKQAQKYFTAGKIWSVKTPDGSIDIKGAILYENYVVGIIHFDPRTGQALPQGYNPHEYTTSLDVNQLQKTLSTVVQNLRVMEGTEYREPEACWAVPLVYNNLIVTHLKVYYNGQDIIPDYPAQQEMSMVR